MSERTMRTLASMPITSRPVEIDVTYTGPISPNIKSDILVDFETYLTMLERIAALEAQVRTLTQRLDAMEADE